MNSGVIEDSKAGIQTYEQEEGSMIPPIHRKGTGVMSAVTSPRLILIDSHAGFLEKKENT